MSASKAMGGQSSSFVDDALLARLRAERDRAVGSKREQLDAVLCFLPDCMGMTFAQVEAKADAELRDAETAKGKSTAYLAAVLGGYLGTKNPVPGSFSLNASGRRSRPGSTAITAAQVLACHTRLHDGLAHPNSLMTGLVRWHCEEYADPEANGRHDESWLSKYMFWPHHVGGQRSRAEWEAKFLVGMARSLVTASTYQVTAPMCEIAEAMYEQTAKVNGHFEAADLPSECGFLWLDKPFDRADANGDTYRTTAVTWSPQSLRRGGEAQEGVRVTLWADWSLDPEAAAREQLQRQADTMPLLMVMSVVVPFGTEFGATRDGGVPMPLHYVHAVWMLLGTEVAAAGRGEVSRGMRKRALKSIRHDQVTVITLRRAHHDGSTEGHRDIDWSCRWIVRGFYRHQWGYGMIGHPHEGRPDSRGNCLACGARVTWVRPYVKGPDDRPLKATQTLYRLSR